MNNEFNDINIENNNNINNDVQNEKKLFLWNHKLKSNNININNF